LTNRFLGATAARLRLQEGGDVPDLVSDRGPVDPTERTADVQPALVLQYLHAATADGGVYMFIDPRPGNRRHMRQIDSAGKAAHLQQPLEATLKYQPERQTVPNLNIDDAIPHPIQLIKKAFKFLLQRQVAATTIGLPQRLGI
jgi:hypothetical protein